MYGMYRNERTNPFRYDTAPKPKREVFPTDEVPHKWAHQAQSRARNPQGNLFFDGDTLYSYRSSYPIGRIVAKRGKAPFALILGRKPYSVTTAQHMHQAARAVSHLESVEVENVRAQSLAEHNANVDAILASAAGHLKKAQRANLARNVAWRQGCAEALYSDAAKYAAFFGLRRKLPAFPAADWQAATERAQRIENPDPVRDAAKFRAKERRAAATRAALQSCFEDHCARVEAHNAEMRAIIAAAPDLVQHWRDTGQRLNLDWPSTYPYLTWKEQRKMRNAGFELPETLHPYALGHGRDDVLLRIDGDQIQTSLGARVPVSVAPMLWKLVQAARNGTPYTRGLSRLAIGDYALDSISADGTLKAGCHTIKFEELERMARALNLDAATVG